MAHEPGSAPVKSTSEGSATIQQQQLQRLVAGARQGTPARGSALSANWVGENRSSCTCRPRHFFP
jgi:hypothetical protein